MILQLLGLLLLLVYPFHDVQVFPDLLLGSDSFLVFVHQPVESLVHSIFQLVLEIGLHVHDHGVEVLADPLVL